MTSFLGGVLAVSRLLAGEGNHPPHRSDWFNKSRDVTKSRMLTHAGADKQLRESTS